MSEQHLATYLNDHLAGSEIALELLDLSCLSAVNRTTAA